MKWHAYGAHRDRGSGVSLVEATGRRCSPPKLCKDCGKPMLVRRNGMGGKQRCDSCAYDRALECRRAGAKRAYLKRKVQREAAGAAGIKT